MFYKNINGYEKNFFEGNDIKSYFSTIENNIQTEIDNLNDNEINSCNLGEWENYFISKHSITAITLLESEINKTISETTIRERNPFYDGSPYESEYFQKDGYKISYVIPYCGNPDLFDLRPSIVTLSIYTTSCFIIPRNGDCGSFTLDLEFTKRELESKKDDMPLYVQKQFENKFTNYRVRIGHVNSDVDNFNKQLKPFISRLLTKRKERSDLFFAISNTLQIPLKYSDDAPNIKPIKLEKLPRKIPTRPTASPVLPEPYISDSDYENINNIIYMCCTAMEKTARTFFENSEEEIRDHLLATLNTHYESTTSETFRKTGKTDIHIEFENKAAYIGECKIWHGNSVFQNAIQQVISYSTWRDVKLSVIIFNKTNQSFQSILKKIQSWVSLNSVSYKRQKTNVWKVKYNRKDINVSIELTILAFDLYVDKMNIK